MGENPWSSQRKAARNNKKRMAEAHAQEYINDDEEWSGSENYKPKKSK